MSALYAENISTLARNCDMNLCKLYVLITFVITLCLQSSCSMRADGETSPGSPGAITIGPAIETAEKLFAAREDIESLRKAVKVLSEARNPAERNYEVEWKFAKFSYFLGKRTESENEANKIFETGRDAGRIASRVQPSSPEGHFWYAANLGELSRLSPITVGIKSVDDIREAMLKVVAIDPGYQGASAFDALGQLEMETRNLKGGKAEKAVEYLEKGLGINKDNANIRLHLAEAYLAVKRDADARKQLDALFDLKPDPAFIPEHTEAVAKGKKLLAMNF
ncbi:MAG TPA: hypothetical protein DDW24_00935 [Blastocatellia bacterium]|nr:hypothetical protein [Blastocatellia bacterium]